MEHSNPNSAVEDTTHIFEAARDRFLGSLKPEDRLLFSPCASPEDFNNAIKKLQATTQRVGRRSKGLKSLHSFTKRLQPYFDVVNIFIQSNPEFSALLWGALRLVLQVSLTPRDSIHRFNLSFLWDSCRAISPPGLRNSLSSLLNSSTRFPGMRTSRNYAMMKIRGEFEKISRKYMSTCWRYSRRLLGSSLEPEEVCPSLRVSAMCQCL